MNPLYLGIMDAGVAYSDSHRLDLGPDIKGKCTE